MKDGDRTYLCCAAERRGALSTKETRRLRSNRSPPKGVTLCLTLFVVSFTSLFLAWGWTSGQEIKGYAGSKSHPRRLSIEERDPGGFEGGDELSDSLPARIGSSSLKI